MEETMYPNDVLVGIGHFMPKGRRGFHCGHREFNGFFYRNKSIQPKVLGKLMFDTNGNFPISEELEQEIANLTFSGMLHSSFQFLNYYQFNSAVDEYYKGFISRKITPEQKKGLEELAKQFEKEFGADERFR